MNPEPTSAQRTYWCFISYRHSDNKEPGRQWATWLHQAIETYEVPEDLVGTVNERGDTIPARIFPVFRDEEELPVDADLASPIYRALDASKFLVVICSPRAVASTYVGSEIRYFKQLGRGDRVLAVMIEGEPNASWDVGKQAHGFKAEDECFPETMRHKVASDGSLLSDQTEPIAADFRLGSGQGWASPEAYRLALRREGLSQKAIDTQVEDYRRKCELMKLKVIAGILGVSLGTLTKRDKAYQLALAQRRAKALRRWLVAVGLLAVLAVASGMIALQQKKEAEAQRKTAVAQRQKAVETLSQSDFLHSIDLIKQDKSAEALAYLARSVRGNPRNQGAFARLYTLLISQRSWFFPDGQTMRHDVSKKNYQGFDERGWSASFSPDGRKVVSASSDYTARLWDANTGNPIGQPMLHGNIVRSAAFSADGRLVVTASADKTARLWDADTGKPIGEPMRIEEANTADFNATSGISKTSACFSPNAAEVVTIYGVITQLWNTRTCKPIGQLIHHEAAVRSATFSPDGTEFATASDDQTAQLWDAHTGKPICEPMRHKDSVYLANFSPDGSEVVTASFDQTARLWDVRTGKTIGEPMRFEAGLISAKFSADGASVVAVSGVGSILIWNAHTGMPLGEPIRHEAKVHFASFSPDGTRVVVACSDDTVRIWDVHSGNPIGEPIRHDARVNSVSFSPDGTKVVTSCSDDCVRIWDVRGGLPIAEPLNEGASAKNANFCADGSRVVTCSITEARVWSVSSGKAIGAPLRLDDLYSASLSPNGTRVITTSGFNTAQLWDALNGQAIGPPMGALTTGGGMVMASFSPDGTKVATSSDDHSDHLWDTTTGQPIGPTMHHEGLANPASFSPDGSRMLIVGYSADIWNVQTCQRVGQLVDPNGTIISAHFSSDSNFIVTGSNDFTARIWDAHTCQPIGHPMRLYGRVCTANFSPDGRQVLTASEDRTCRIWDIDTGQTIGQPMVHDSALSFACYRADGAFVVTASLDSSIRLWDAESGQSGSDPIFGGPTLRKGWSPFSVSFSPDGSRVLMPSETGAAVWDILPPNHAEPPSWLPDLAEAVGGFALSDSGSLVTVDRHKFFDLKAQLGNAPGDDFWSKVGRWFFADRDTRTISPQSSITIPEYRAREAEAAKQAAPVGTGH